MTQIDTDFVRSQFPAFSQVSLQNQAFFENAGGSYPCHQVVEKLTRFYTEFKVQPYAPYAASTAAGAQMDEAYEKLAGLFNVDVDELNFGPSTTQNTYVLANAFKSLLSPGDEIIVTNQDHEANSGSWRRLANDGIVVREWQVNAATGELSLEDLDDLLSERVKLVTFPHCSNIVGHINPVAEISKRAHAIGAISIVDGVSYAPHGLPDIEALGADIYFCSLYKVYGPHQGVMIVRRELREKLANQSHYFNADEARSKLVPAGPDHAQIAAAAGVADYFEEIYRHHYSENADKAEMARRVSQLFRNQEQRLLANLLDYLDGRNDLRVLGPTDPIQRAPTIAIDTFSRDPWELAVALGKAGVMTCASNFYAPRVLDAMGVDSKRGVLRLSFVHYTSDQEIEKVKTALDTVLS